MGGATTWIVCVEVIMKKRSDHEIFITKIYIHVIFSNFMKILNHENLELYSIYVYIHCIEGTNKPQTTVIHINLIRQNFVLEIFM